MTVASQVAIQQYNTDGATNAFAWPSSLFALADLNVVLFNPATGLALTPAPALNGGGPNDYTLAGNQDPQTGEYLGGVTVAFNAVQAAGQVLTLTDGLAPTQQTSLSNNAPFPAKAIEAALDRLTLLAQRLLLLVGLAPSVPDFDAPPGSLSLLYPPAAQRANSLAGFDANGNAIAVPMPPAVGGTLRVSDGTNIIASATSLKFPDGWATVSQGLTANDAVVVIAPPGNKFEVKYNGYSVDSTFNPPLIEQWMTATVTVENFDTTIQLFYPTHFPNGAIVQAVAWSGAFHMNYGHGVVITATDLRTYCTIDVYGAIVGNTFTVSVLLKGY